ncbi:MAG: CPBP family intramembrane metalloprotease [Firmicutes bacterium]|nr:CPBP family intramembrane metalloprotease [Bacillota bacterium]
MSRASFCFIAIICAGLFLRVAFANVVGDSFAAFLGISVVVYLIGYVGVFLLFQNIGKQRNVPRVLLSDFHLKPIPQKSNGISVTNLLVVVIIAFMCIASFMMVQFASIEIFRLMGAGEYTLDLSIDNFGMFMFAVFALAVLPAVIEELLFRGIVYKSLLGEGKQKKHIYTAIIISSLLFAGFHLSPEQLVYQFILGVIYAIVFYKTGNLLYPMLLHFINNFFVIAYTFIAGSDYMSYTWGATTIVTTILLALMGGAIIYGLLGILKKEYHATTK